MFAVKAKIYGLLYKQSSAIAFYETSSYWSAPKSSAFHWSPHGSLVSIGRNFVTVITKSDQSGPNHQLLQPCTACTAWSDSDQAVRAVHSCSSWFWCSILVQYSLKSIEKANVCQKPCYPEGLRYVCMSASTQMISSRYHTILKKFEWGQNGPYHTGSFCRLLFAPYRLKFDG